ncbi:MAG: sensor histidine kinase [Burkholderiaceae bacterium]|nr:sensor histidine kinase [Burkholderiaceae bacterium]MCZ8176906.1 sensor histidine kinase [Burkholderiaceae bacterium]
MRASQVPTLARRLLVPLAWIWLVGLGVAVTGAAYIARDAAQQAFDRSLRDEASAIAARVIWSDRGPLLDVSRQIMELLTWDSVDRNGFVMVDIEGMVLAGDAAVPVPPFDVASLEQPQLFDARYQGQPVRGAVFSVTSPMIDRRVSIIVVETTTKRAALVRDLQLAIVLPALALGLVTFGLLGWGVNRGLRPLRRLSGEIGLRELHDWRPLPLQRVPAEALPMVERINDLMLDVQHSVALQRRFVADAAHQLRTPVAGIRVLAQELERELQRAGVEPGRALLAELQSSTQRLSRLIGQLLSLASSETSLTLQGEQATMDIVPLVREAAEPQVLEALRQGRQIELDAPGQPVPARAHPIWLGEVVANLLDNARRYGGMQIRLRVAPLDGGGAEVVVEDDGPGVRPDELPRLFEPFWRGERADLRSDGGTGLGLAIAHEIVARLGGTLEVATRPQVDGMRFTVRLVA